VHTYPPETCEYTGDLKDGKPNGLACKYTCKDGDYILRLEGDYEMGELQNYAEGREYYKDKLIFHG